LLARRSFVANIEEIGETDDLHRADPY
jgi:hypothetical protein